MYIDYSQIQSIIESMNRIIGAMKKERIDMGLLGDIQLTVREVNAVLYNSSRLTLEKEHNLSIDKDYADYVSELEQIVALWIRSINRRSQKAVDAVFWQNYEMFKYVDREEIFNFVVKRFQETSLEYKDACMSLQTRYTFLKNTIDYKKEDYSLIKEHVDLLATNIEQYKWLYERMADYRSKYVLNGIIQYWLSFNLEQLYDLGENIYKDYYDLDILDSDENAVFVDLGAYVGDSIYGFVDTYGPYKKIYAYEIMPSTCETLRKNLAAFDNVIINQKGAGEKSQTMYIDESEVGQGNKVLNKGDREVEVVSLDDDIKESISIIKMDIEGAEKDAIKGAMNHIKNEKPKLLVSAYHLSEDIFEIPKLIDGMRDDYKFYMRYNGHQAIWPCDYILFAV